MKVSEFIEWLKAQDQEATVCCFVHDSVGGYYKQGGSCEEQEFTQEYSRYTDFRGNEFVTEWAPHFNKRYLLIGGEI